MTDTPTIADLHRLGVAHGFPRARIHEILHEQAAYAWHVDSLCDLTADQRRQLAEFVRLHNGRPSHPRRPSKRKRRGRPKRDGVVRMMTQPQRNFIDRLASEMRWSRSLLNNFLRTHFEAATMDHIGTSSRASEVINRLIGYKRKKERHQARSGQRRLHAVHN